MLMTTQSATATTAERGESIRFIPVQSTLYPWLVTLFVVTFLISNINATKGVQLGPLITDGAFFLFPLAYIVGDVLSECYGFKSTRRAVAIGFAMAILAAIAYPSYQEHIRKTRRAQAKADLVEYAQLAERYHTVNNSYEGFTLPASQSPREEGATAQYNLVLTVDKKTAASQFRITAEPTGAQAEDRCGKLSLDQASVKRHSKGDYKECW